MSKIMKVLAALVAFAVIVVLALPTLVHKLGLHPEYHGPEFELAGKRALIITTSHSVLAAPGETEGPATGVAASEMTHPYYTFLDGGMSVDVASIEGGEIPIAPDSLGRVTRSPLDERFLADPVFTAKAQKSIKIDDVDFSEYDLIFLAGGWGAAYDLGYSEILAQKIGDAFYAEHKPVLGGVCHGVLGFINVKGTQGNLLIAGRAMTGVSDKQIKELNIEITPQHPETELRKAGALYESQTAFRDVFATHVVIDQEQRFVTGQNQNSGLETAHKMMQVIAERDK